MKKIFYSIMAAAALLTGCNNSLIVQQGTGSLSFDVDFDVELKNVITTKASAEENDIINSLMIDIERDEDPEFVWEPKPYIELRSKPIELGAGSYTMTASSPERKEAAYDQPIFEGSTKFNIEVGQVSKASIVCSVVNTKVSLVLSERFNNELSSYTITVTNGRGTLTWTKASDYSDFQRVVLQDGTVRYTAIKAGYFTVGPLAVTVSGLRYDGTEAGIKYQITNVNAAENHILNLDANVTGSLNGITITINPSVKDVDEPVVVPGFEEIPVPGDGPSGGDDNGGNETPDTPENPGDDAESSLPHLVWEKNPTFMAMNLSADSGSYSLVNGTPMTDVKLVIKAEKGIRDFIINVNSVGLAPFIAFMAGGLPVTNDTVTMDLINNNQIYQNLKPDLPGLPMKDELSGKTEVNMDMTDLVPMINAASPSVGDVHVFNIVIIDEDGNRGEHDLTINTVA